MRKKTAPRTRKHPKASRNQTSGLIAKDKTSTQSARRKTILDNRSHRRREMCGIGVMHKARVLLTAPACTFFFWC